MIYTKYALLTWKVRNELIENEVLEKNNKESDFFLASNVALTPLCSQTVSQAGSGYDDPLQANSRQKFSRASYRQERIVAFNLKQSIRNEGDAKNYS